jgi:hypothetical protein
MRFSCAVVLCCLVFGLARARADDKMEAALYWGRNATPRMFENTASDALSHRLHEVFGFKNYVLVKTDKINLEHTWTQWFIPRKDFFICLKPLKQQPDEPRLVDYEIYQEGFIVAKGKYEPAEGTPLFINGPDFKKGRLILVLETH